MSKTCPQCHANLGAMTRTDGYYCTNCCSLFVPDPDEWLVYRTDYGVFDR